MASVWRANDRRLDRHVAIKVLSEQLATDTSFRERFQREAIHVASLKHPNIVTVYDAGSDGDTYYIVMELVEGESLQARLEATAPYMGLERTQELAAQLLAGLSHAHGKGIVHRDIKPANILIAGDDTAKLVDFGIARAASDLRSLTTMGQFMGTPAYASPEQLDARSSTAETDLYSLGCVLYECLAGHPPFEAEVPVGVIISRPRLARCAPRDPMCRSRWTRSCSRRWRRTPGSGSAPLTRCCVSSPLRAPRAPWRTPRCRRSSSRDRPPQAATRPNGPVSPPRHRRKTSSGPSWSTTTRSSATA